MLPFMMSKEKNGSCIFDIKVKSKEEDPYKKWITTLNNYLMILGISLPDIYMQTALQ